MGHPLRLWRSLEGTTFHDGRTVYCIIPCGKGQKPKLGDEARIIEPWLARTNVPSRLIDLPELKFEGKPTDDGLTAWATELRKAWAERKDVTGGGYLLNCAIFFVALLAPYPLLRENAGRVLELLGGNDFPSAMFKMPPSPPSSVPRLSAAYILRVYDEAAREASERSPEIRPAKKSLRRPRKAR
jgi:hypothetical protein